MRSCFLQLFNYRNTSFLTAARMLDKHSSKACKSARWVNFQKFLMKATCSFHFCLLWIGLHLQLFFKLVLQPLSITVFIFTIYEFAFIIESSFLIIRLTVPYSLPTISAIFWWLNSCNPKFLIISFSAFVAWTLMLNRFLIYKQELGKRRLV